VVSNLVFLGGIVGQNFSSLDKAKVSLEFEKWKAQMREENPYELEKLEELTPDKDKQLEVFIAAKQGQLKAMVMELRILLGLSLAVMFLSRMDWDDDETPDIKQVVALRRVIRLTEKVRTEIGFVFSVSDWENTLSKPLPMLSTLVLLSKAIKNFGDETRDIFVDDPKDDKKDNAGWFYYSKKFAPGYKFIEPLIDELESRDSP